MISFVIYSIILARAASESCYYQQCLNCPPESAYLPGVRQECHPTNWVSADWIHNLGHPPPSTSSIVPIEYRCLKMVATPTDKSLSRTIDVIKGCVPKRQEDSVCQSLLALERARGKSDSRCYTCWGNNCNTAATVRVYLLPLITTVVSYIMY